ncbi:hypothetical protein FW774_11490 [Pedobacter sp. BS3]|uniref:hypothetical protein n=1 Tax=Pedobacter sp. BS3 TaxID=2567937 RepID=UPI0011EFE48E|nr:hypothetical protein [Pedobacter sp. BS3]TZF84059.1 hypothetical protein FW774_11490 [Pedobacter sp. BS3]
MAVLKDKKTRQNLLKKGFVNSDSHHHFYEFWHNGTLIAKTRTSHNGQDIDDYLIKSMSQQCKVDKDFFKAFAKCTKSQNDYINELIKNNIITSSK